ncbi:kinase domain protein [Ceratobasidium sp. AG-Ba]|nr:kinase domain protein [Ceratobasidium sp. AG-Ba]
MAQANAQQGYYPQQQMAQYPNKGPLQPGQTIKLSQCTVTVERYLSQGGFAHVYLVRTPQPVMGTTTHVLKRMAVADVATLAEVKKEVDIMRLLRGHPNIVHLLDSASRPLPNGQHEVYILMEFCQGGGIIDMMNRRLRERLTEKDILQIFVDVCEAVACMHALQPALLHRDLKVENILQASDTSFKLCDFGSAAPARPKPPSTMEEIKMLEADLNRSTTLQYRAPEMVDVYLRRPIDEKSDVWALGVLLYKLCYYTTPFEAHGPLAILHVQYTIPGYPVYSKEMNALIGAMLRELGVQRPTVFEVLNVVHRMRGTKSAFHYGPRPQQSLPSPQVQQPMSPPDQLIQVGQRPSAAQAQREKQLRDQKEALDAMNMRRGRPGEVAPSSPAIKPTTKPTLNSPSKLVSSSPAKPSLTSPAKPASPVKSPTTAVKSPVSNATSPLPVRQPLAPLTRSRPSKSGSRDSVKSRGQNSPTKTTVAPALPARTTGGVKPRAVGSNATGNKTTPVNGSKVMNMGGVSGVSGLGPKLTGSKLGAAKSPTADFFNDDGWKKVEGEPERDIWGGGGSTVPTAPATTTSKFDGFADSFDSDGGANGSTLKPDPGASRNESSGFSARPSMNGGAVPLPGLHRPTSNNALRPSSQLGMSSTHHSSTPHHHSSQTPHHHSSQVPRSNTLAPRDAFEGLGISPSPSPALSLRDLAARSPNPSPGIPGTSPMPIPSMQVPAQSPSPFSRSPHPLTTGTTTGILTTQATAGSSAASNGGPKSALALSAEERFPSIEELDAGKVSDAWGKPKEREKDKETPKTPALPPRPGVVSQRSHMTGPNSLGLRAPVQTGPGVRSQQVTGTAMKDGERAATPKTTRALPVPPTTNSSNNGTSGTRPSTSTGVRRVASLTARDREKSSSPSRAGSPAKTPASPTKTPASPSKTPASPAKRAAAAAGGGRAQSQTARPDWLTGDFLETAQALGISVPASPGKRSSALLGTHGTGGGNTGGGGAGMRYQAPLKSPSGAETSRAYAEHGRATPTGGRATPLGRATPSSGRQMSMNESSNDEGPEDPTSQFGRSRLERRGAVSTRSPDRKNRSATLDVATSNPPTSGTVANTPAQQLHRRQPSENLVELGPGHVLSSARSSGRLSMVGSTAPVRTPSTTSSTGSHPPTSGPRGRRPQSMFIAGATPGPGSGLTPPADPNAATEALATPAAEHHTGSNAPQRRPSIANKPAGLRVPSGATPAPARRRSPSPVGASRSPERTENTTTTSVFAAANRVRTSPKEIMREVPIQDGRAPSPTTAGRTRSRPPSPLKLTQPLASPTPAPLSGRHGRVHNITPPHAKEVGQETRAPEPPASPDKPYQGVGRLIDQWQKKAGAAEPARPMGARVGRR